MYNFTVVDATLTLCLDILYIWDYGNFQAFCLGSSNKFLLVSVSLLPQIQMLNLFIDHCRENFPEQSCSDRRTVWPSSKWMLIQKSLNLFRRSSGQKLFGVVAGGRLFIAANEDVGGCWHWSGHQRPNTGGHTLGQRHFVLL